MSPSRTRTHPTRSREPVREFIPVINTRCVEHHSKELLLEQGDDMEMG